ncbi:MAG: type II toxin-antitoxin system HicB family antitoxin [Planctomycetota bacterium]
MISPSAGTTKASRDAIDRPFDPDILARAEAIASGYRILLDRDEDGSWIGSSVELPTVFGEGDTPDACVESTVEALIGAVAHMIELGRHPPESSARTEQVNVRLTPEEKFVLVGAAQRIGFQGMSDFIRVAALERAGRVPVLAQDVGRHIRKA